MPLRALAAGLALVALVGCTENFGPPPPGGRPRVTVRDEGFAGPVLPRAALSAAGRPGALFVATDAGLYRADTGAASVRWWPVHGGISDSRGVQRVARVERVVSDPRSSLVAHVARVGADDFLTLSEDGGAVLRAETPPNVLARTIAALGVLPPSVWHPRGAWVVAQGADLFLREPGRPWRSADLPAAPLDFGPIAGDEGGVCWIAVRTASGPALWSSADGGVTFLDAGIALSEPVLALAASGGRVAWADATGVHGTEGERVRWDGARVEAGALRFDGTELRWALLGSGGRLAAGRGSGEAGPGTALDVPVVPASLTLVGGEVWIVADDVTLIRLGPDGVGEVSFGGGDLNWTSIGTSFARGPELLLGQGRTGEVFRGEASEPASMRSLGTPRFQSESRSLLPDPARPGAVYAGSFGCFWNDGSDVVWEDRSDGQSNYLLALFDGPITARALAASPVGTLWLGGVNGNGPYLSTNGGLDWQRRHGGLGTPGTIAGEDGLPAATEVTAFDFEPEGTTRMATFRGGVWRLEAGAEGWTQENEGLPDLSGSPVDTCCFEPLGAEVDVRDLARLPGGRLLAATGWGVHRREDGSLRWTDASLGLTNGDVFALAVHPTRREWVVAAARGTAENPDWLFLSEDGGLTWTPVATALVARWARDVVWSRESAAEVVVLLQGQGAWRMELDR